MSRPVCKFLNFIPNILCACALNIFMSGIHNTSLRYLNEARDSLRKKRASHVRRHQMSKYRFLTSRNTGKVDHRMIVVVRD